MDKNEVLKKIIEDEDYIRCPKLSNSLTKFLSKYPEGVEDSTISRLLMMNDIKVKEIYEEIISKLRNGMIDS